MELKQEVKKMSNATIQCRNRIYRYMLEQGKSMLKTNIGKETGTARYINECLRDLIKFNLVKKIEYLNNNFKYLALDTQKGKNI